MNTLNIIAHDPPADLDTPARPSPREEPLSPDTPKMVPGNETDSSRWLQVPWLGIQFRRFKSSEMTVLATRWKNAETNDSHIYQIEIRRDGDSPNAGWRAMARRDLRLIFTISGKSRDMVQRGALAAMKAYLTRGHRKARKTWLAARRAKEVES